MPWTTSKAQLDVERAIRAEAARVPQEQPRARSVDALVEHFRKALNLSERQVAQLSHIRRNTIYACAMLRADSIARLPLKGYRFGGGARAIDIRKPRMRLGMPRFAREVTEVTPVDKSPLLDLLSRPNPDWTGRQLLKSTEIGLGVVGQAHWWVSKASISFIKHDRMELIKAAAGDRERTVKGWWLDRYRATQRQLDADEVLWLRYPDPEDPDYGALSPADVATLGAESYIAAMRSNRDIFKQGIRAGGVFLPPEEYESLDADQVRELSRDIELLMKGAEKNHATPVLPYRFEFKSLGMTPKDAEFAALLDFAIEDTARAFRIPIEKVGGARRTYQNLPEADLQFWGDCLVPEVEWLAEELTHKLLPLYPNAGIDFLAFDLSGVAPLQEDDNARWERYRLMIEEGVPLNTILALEGMDPVPWGDVWWAPMAKAPVSGGGETQQAAKPVGELLRQLIGTRAPEYDSAEHRRIMRIHESARRPHEKRIKRTVVDLFERQRDSLVDQLKTQRAQRIGLKDISKMFNRARWIREFRRALRRELPPVLETGIKVVSDDIGTEIEFGADSAAAVRFMQKRAQRFATEVNETTWQRLKDSLSEGISGGESGPQLAKRVEAVMGDRIRSNARTIARTEVLGAVNGGSQLAAEASGLELEKEWLSALDERVRPTHREAHGQRRKIDEDFVVGNARGPTPGQLGDPNEDINCRCIASYVVAGRASVRTEANNADHEIHSQ